MGSIASSRSILTPEEVRQSLRASKREAVANAVMLGLTDPFMIPYALALGASAFQAGLLSSARNAILSLLQLKSADAVQRLRSKKRLLLWTVGIQIVLWIPLALVGPLFGPWAVAALILLYTMGTTIAAFGNPAGGSLVSRYLTPQERGQFFGHLARRMGLCSTAAALLGGGFLQVTAGRPWLGFGLLCAGAAVARTFSWRWFTQLAEGPWEESPEEALSLWQFFRQRETSNFLYFTLSIAAMSFSVNLAAPYLAVYMLKELHYNYFTYTIISLSLSFVAALVVPAWGKVGDRFGNQVVLRWTMVGVSILPFLWPISRNPAWLAMVFMVAGFFWVGLNLCTVNFVYDAAAPFTRDRYLAYFNVINGCSMSLGALTGGWLLGKIPPTKGSVFITLFYCSGLLRFGSALVFRRLVREVRPVRQVGLREVLYELAGERIVQLFGK